MGLVFIMFCFSVVGWLYQFGGLKYYLKAASYVQKHSDTYESFYGPPGQKEYAGILAGVWGKGIAIWGQYGLRYFPATTASTYHALIGCQKLKIGPDTYSSSLMTQSLNDDYRSVKEWGADMHPGDMAFVRYTDERVPKIKEAWGVNYWMFENADVQIQCQKGGVK